MHMPSSSSNKPTSVKTVLKKLLGPKQKPIQRWVLSQKASTHLKAVHDATGIDMNVLADAAIAAVKAAMVGSNEPLKIRDAKLRAWLNRPPDQEG